MGSCPNKTETTLFYCFFLKSAFHNFVTWIHFKVCVLSFHITILNFVTSDFICDMCGAQASASLYILFPPHFPVTLWLHSSYHGSINRTVFEARATMTPVTTREHLLPPRAWDRFYSRISLMYSCILTCVGCSGEVSSDANLHKGLCCDLPLFSDFFFSSTGVKEIGRICI